MNEREIRNKLTPVQYAIMRGKKKEPPYLGKHWDVYDDGIYACAACNEELFSSRDKFSAGTGYPCFKKPIDEKRIEFKKHVLIGENIQIRCRKCRAVLGEVVRGGRDYYRINSVCIDFKKKPEPMIARPAPAPAEAPQKEHVPPAPSRQPLLAKHVIAAVIIATCAGIVLGAAGMFLFSRAAANAAGADTTEPLAEEGLVVPATVPDLQPDQAEINTEDLDTAEVPANDQNQATSTP